MKLIAPWRWLLGAVIFLAGVAVLAVMPGSDLPTLLVKAIVGVAAIWGLDLLRLGPVEQSRLRRFVRGRAARSTVEEVDPLEAQTSSDIPAR